MRRRITLSIILTSYNIEDYVRDCLDSVLAQHFEDFELIAVDDGSTDGTPAVIDSYTKRDHRLRLIRFPRNTPGGVGRAANAGLDAARGNFIGFVDGDDWCDPDMFSSLIDKAESSGVDIALCRFRIYDQRSGQLSDPPEAVYWTKDLTASGPELTTKLRKRLLRLNAVPWRKLYRRSLLDEHGLKFPESDYSYEDNPFHWYCLINARSFAMVDRVLCYHRMQRPGQTTSADDTRLLGMFQHHDTIRNWLAARGELDRYQGDLVVWLMQNVDWISRRMSPEHYPELMASIRRALQPGGDRAPLYAGLGTGDLDVRSWALARSALSGCVRCFGRLCTDRQELVDKLWLRYWWANWRLARRKAAVRPSQNALRPRGLKDQARSAKTAD